MKKLLALILVLTLVLSFAGIASAESVTLKLSEVHKEGYPTTLADQEFARLVEEKTEGRIKIDVFPNGSLYAAEPDAIQALQVGDLGFARVSASPVASYVPSINAIQMPYLYRDVDHMWNVLNGEIGQNILAGIEAAGDSGLIGLCYYDAGSRCFYLTKEVKTVADIAGLKIRMQDNAMMKRMVELLGGTPVTGIGPGDVYSSITTGVIDGAENNWPTYESNGDFEAAKFYILDDHTRVPEILLASADVMATLSAEDQAIIRECAKATQEFEIAKWLEREKASEEIVRAAGAQVVELTPEAKAEFVEKTLPLYDEFGAEYADIIAAIKAVE